MKKWLWISLFTLVSFAFASDTVDIKAIQGKAEMGNIEAQVLLAGRYLIGEGVDKNSSEAVKWFRKAAEKGSPVAQYFLGSCYYLGDGVEQDITTAVKLYNNAAEQNDVDAQFMLGSIYDSKDLENPTEAFKWYIKAAEQGHAEAQFSVGCAYAEGLWNVEKNQSEAFQWFLKSAEQGNLKAQMNIGTCYYNVQDYVNAEKWLRKAAEQGEADAEYKLAAFFLETSMKKSEAIHPETLKWLYKAAEQGHMQAQYQLGILLMVKCKGYQAGLLKLTDTKIVAEDICLLSKQMLKKAAAQGHKEAAKTLEDWDNLTFGEPVNK